MKIALVFVVMLLVAVYGIRHWRSRNAANAEQRARVLRLDPRTVDPSTRALLLFETIPHLQSAERDEAIKQLRDVLQAVPRPLLVHRPSFDVETLRFSGNGRSMLWYGKPKDGRITIEKSLQRAPRVASWRSKSSYATFMDDEGSTIVSDDESGIDQGGTRTARTETRRMLSSDGAYGAVFRDDLLFIWKTRDDNPTGRLVAELPSGTRRLHCVESIDLCGLESPGRFTFVDVKKRSPLRSLSVDPTGVVRMSPTGALVGVGHPREGITIHAAHHDRKIHLGRLALADFAFSADGKSVVALGSDGVLHSYDAASGKPRLQSDAVRHEQWQRTARVEAVGDGRVVVWDAEKVRLVSADLSTVTARFDQGADVILVKANARGDRLAIARREGPLTLWDISAKRTLPFMEEELFESVCGHIGRALTAEEWATYIPDRLYEPRCQ